MVSSTTQGGDTSYTARAQHTYIRTAARSSLTLANIAIRFIWSMHMVLEWDRFEIITRYVFCV